VEFFNGKPLRLYGTFQDINEQKSKDIEFEKVKNQIYTYFQSTNESICLLDFDCNITGFNKVFKDLVFRIYNKHVKIGDSIFD
jgi:hypothetical protein